MDPAFSSGIPRPPTLFGAAAENLPCHVCATRPGDVVGFSMRSAVKPFMYLILLYISSVVGIYLFIKSIQRCVKLTLPPRG